ncbi:MAG: hypothetical protein CMG01_00050 [Candidatus Marinimicrobia bacterium]|nr:hypothetical protein [Candidatus Neomarinimicrobiota bacterium]|tara:strand:+ start:8480 stop:9187 length:708 start_codon:yes stop_codon:yes gene_type:complete
MKNKLKIASFLTRSTSKELIDRGYVHIKNLIEKEKLDLIINNCTNHDLNKFIKYDNDIRLFSVMKVVDNDSKNFLLKKIKTLFNKNVLFGSFYTHYFMFNKILSGGIGSGGDWHRDSGYLNQYKLIIFLNGTNDKNGPFQILEDSFSFESILNINKELGLKGSPTRFKHDQIIDLIKSNKSKYSIKSFHVNPGDAIFVNTRAIHRGKPPKIGGRLALTSYSYIKTPAHMHKLFNE